MGGLPAEGGAQSFSNPSPLTMSGATSWEHDGVGFVSDEDFRRVLAEMDPEMPLGIVPCKSSSWIYDSWKFQPLETDFGYPAGRMFAPGIIQFGQTLSGGFVGQVHDGRILGPAKTSVVIKSVDLAQEKGLEGLPYLLREARAYEDLKKLAGKCLPRFFGSGVVDNQYALVVEKVPGRMLHTLSDQEKAECRGQVLKAYNRLHAAGYVQGDVTGSNVLVDKKRVTIVDLGAAEKVARSSEKIKVEDESVLELFG